jgi:site-specific recombinase XerD
MESFMAYRKTSDNWNDFYEWVLYRFDDYCCDNFPDATALSQEMIDNWCKQRSTESNNTCIARNHAIVALIKYLRARGKTNVNLPTIPRQEPKTHVPHAFTEQEIINFFNACDNIICNNSSILKYARKIILPVQFRLLYSSGIRAVEARLLRTEDVDLQNGVLDIQFSKGYDQHYVALHDSMTGVMRRYDAEISKIYPNRKYFFPSHNGEQQSRHWLSWNFRQI